MSATNFFIRRKEKALVDTIHMERDKELKADAENIKKSIRSNKNLYKVIRKEGISKDLILLHKPWMRKGKIYN